MCRRWSGHRGHLGAIIRNMGVLKTTRRYVRRVLDPLYRPQRHARIVMFHNGRSGSGVLGRILNDHPRILWDGELLRDTKIAKYLRRGNFDPWEYIRHTEYKAGRYCYGFEMKYRHMCQLNIAKKEFLENVSNLGYAHFILLERRNLLRRIISQRILLKAGFAHLRNGQKPELYSVHLDTKDLLKTLELAEREVIEMQKLLQGKSFVHLIYEQDILSDPLIAYEKVCVFLGLSVHPLKPRLRRTNPFMLHEMLSNYQEVAKTLRNTPYAWMLDDPDYDKSVEDLHVS